MVMIDNVATRYHKLPSEILAGATTFDLLVANTGSLWEQKQREDAEARSSGKTQAPRAPKLSQAQMLDMLKRAREQ